MPKSLLLMFDLDGTLTDSMGVDSDAFAAALRQWLGTAQLACRLQASPWSQEV
jgi:beta-phosphoglucomutase-like phosphatase (HAD superfamily)